MSKINHYNNKRQTRLYSWMLISLISMSCILFLSPVSVSAKTYDTSQILEEYKKTTKTATVFIGDSRTVLMDYYLSLSECPDTFVIAKSGEGYDYLEKEALPALAKICETHSYDRYNIVCNLGVNDLENLNKYIDILPMLEQYGTLYYVSVNPVIDRITDINSKEVEAFNNAINKHTDRYIDCYSYLQKTGFTLPDGLHFDDITSKKIHSYICQNISTWEFLEATEHKNITTEQVTHLVMPSIP